MSQREVIEIMNTNKEKWWTAEDIAELSSVTLDTVRHNLAKLHLNSEVEVRDVHEPVKKIKGSTRKRYKHSYRIKRYYKSKI